MARILIAGCGDVGTALGLALAADGDEVVGLRRHPEGLPAPILGVAGDLVTGDGVADAAEGVNALVYAAAADRFSDDAYRRTYVDGLANVLAALRAARAPLEHVLFTSSTAVYAQSDGGWVDETSPTEPQGFSGRTLLEAEELLARSGIPATVLRLAGIYGPGRTRLIEEVRSGAVTVDDGAPVFANRIHVADCAGAIRHLLRLPSSSGIWLGVDHDPCERGVVLDWLADRMGAPRPRRVTGAVRERGGNKRCSNAKLVRSGYVFRHPSFRDGYGELVSPAPQSADSSSPTTRSAEK
jgi:nucleoside-diphosphate-sugar epimerase